LCIFVKEDTAVKNNKFGAQFRAILFGQTSHSPEKLLLKLILASLFAFSRICFAADVRAVDQTKCVPGESTWSYPERAMWRTICTSGAVDYSSLINKPVIRGQVISEILTRPPFSDVVQKTGFLITGAIVVGDIDLRSRRIISSVYLRNCVIRGNVNIDDADFDGDLSLVGSTVIKEFTGRRARIEGSLIFGVEDKDDAHGADIPRGAVEIGGIMASFIKIKGNLSIVGATLDDGIYIPYSKISGMLDIESVESSELNATADDVDGQIVIVESKFDFVRKRDIKPVIRVQRDYKEDGPLEDENHMATVNLFQINANHGLFLDRSEIADSVILSDAKITGELSLNGTSLHELDMSGALISGNLMLGYNKFAITKRQRVTMWVSPSMQDPGPTKLDLSRSKISVIRAPANMWYWPELIDLRGASVGNFINAYLLPATKGDASDEKVGIFREISDQILMGECHFVHMGCFQTSSDKVFSASRQEKFENFFPEWLSRYQDGDFSPQPYQAFGTLLEESNEHEAAVEVGYSAKNAELREACKSADYFQCVMLLMSKVTIGFGYFIGRAVVISILFVIIGSFVFRRTRESKKYHMPIGLIYSFDMFMPIVRLREFHYKIDIRGPVRYYFYIHKLAGWLLGSFIIAGLSGITK
jgi:hypothetical protein